MKKSFDFYLKSYTLAYVGLLLLNRRTFFFPFLAGFFLFTRTFSQNSDSLGTNAKIKTQDTSNLELAKPHPSDSVATSQGQQKRNIKNLLPIPHGTISGGYEYGIIPFATNTNFPLGYYKSEGNISVDPLGLPVNFSYFYSTLHTVAGLNNYFRVSFDAARYKEKLQMAGIKNLENEKDKLAGFLGQKQLLEQKLAYLQMLKQQIPDSSSLNAKLNSYKNKYNINPSVPNTDSLKNLPGVNLPNLNLPYSDSIKNITNQLHKYDSINNLINSYSKEIQSIQNQVEATKKKIAIFQNPELVSTENLYKNKSQSILSGIKNFDIGLCYPNYSTFLINGSTVKGINVEWEKKLYFAFTYGKTINTIMTTNNIIQNQLQASRNLYNFFDFNNVRDSRKIMAFKFGLGKKESTHLHAGILFGMGMPSYLSNANFSTPSVEKNVVVELDGRYSLNANNSVDLVYGKSVVYQNGIPENPEIAPSQVLFSNFRSHAALARYTSNISKTKTKIILTGRMIDPFFKSYGAGFMRSDNLRYEFKIEQVINDKIKFTGFYRKDRDNLLNVFLYTTSLQTIGTNLSIKINRRLTARVMYSPVIQNISSKDNSYSLNKLNNISTGVLSYTPRFNKVVSSFVALYSYYQLSDGLKGRIFQNMSLNNTTIFNSFIRTNLGTSWFMSNSTDSLNSSTAMVNAELAVSGKKGASLTGGVKYAYNTLLNHQLGGLLRLNIPLIKHLNAEMEAQRLVIGDFYNSMYQSEVKKFPYYGYLKIILSW